MINTIFILSWFGNEKVRDKRIEYHNNQLDWCLEQKLKVVILPQKYNKNEYRYDTNITYLKEPLELLGPSKGRNLLYKEYWNSNLDYAIFADNDCIINPDKGDGKDFLLHMNTNFSKYDRIDIMIPIDPGKDTTAQDIHRLEKNKDLYDYNHVFSRSLQLKGSMFFIRNIKKAYGLEYYHPEVYDEIQSNGTIMGGEDNDLAFWFCSKKLGVCHFHNLILLEWARKLSTWTPNDKTRKMLELAQFNVLRDRFGVPLRKQSEKYGVPYGEYAIKDAKHEFIKANSKLPHLIVIPFKFKEQDLIVWDIDIK